MPSEPRVRAVFFDLDDTLCDTIGTREARARRAFEYLCRTQSGLDADLLVRRALEPLAEPRSALGVRGVLEEFFFVVSAGAGYEKPDPRIFQHALSLAEVEPAEAVFVGDRLDVDVGGAKAAGMRAIWFNHWGGKLDGASPGPDAVIERFVELPGVLNALAGT